MAKVEWTDDLNLGIPSIDAQHRELVNCINELSESMAKGEGNKKLADTFDKVAKYTSTHFVYEEKMLTSFGYQETAFHQKEHEALKKEIAELQTKFKNGQMAISVTTHKFLMSWLTNHIQVSDRKYTPFLLSKGAK